MTYRSILAIPRKPAQTKPPKFLRAQAERELGRCPRCLSRDLGPVSPPYTCPRCGAPLEEIYDQGGTWD